MRQVLSSLLVIAGLVSGQAIAAPESPPHADIRDSGFVYCVSGQVNTFNPSKASSGLIVDTLAAQFYDRLLDVDPYTYRLMPELAESWEVLDNGATYRFHLRRDVPFQKTDWFTPTRKMNADDVVFTFQRIFDRNNPWHNVNGSNFPYFDSLQFADNVKSVRKLDNHTVEFRLGCFFFVAPGDPLCFGHVGRICREVRERRSPGATRPSTGRHRSVSVVGIPRRAIYSLTTS
jgi:cationic peptide transport system substrate-binding protein